jgi:hypothetical protein
LLRALDERRHHRALKSAARSRGLRRLSGFSPGASGWIFLTIARSTALLRPAEAEIRAPVGEPGDGETEDIRVSQPREAIEDILRDSQTRASGDLVISLLRGVVSRLSQKAYLLLP